jgi:hypothetical protein
MSMYLPSCPFLCYVLANYHIFSFFLFFFGSTGVWTWGLMLDRQKVALTTCPTPQALYCFLFFVFVIGSSDIVACGWLQTMILLMSAFCVARITGGSHCWPASNYHTFFSKCECTYNILFFVFLTSWNISESYFNMNYFASIISRESLLFFITIPSLYFQFYS